MKIKSFKCLKEIKQHLNKWRDHDYEMKDSNNVQHCIEPNLISNK
jgi:hypothetical protein